MHSATPFNLDYTCVAAILAFKTEMIHFTQKQIQKSPHKP
jgi:hypothetical protein